MDEPKNLNEALLPFTTLFAILGHTVFQYPVGTRKILFSRIYSTIIAVSYCAAYVSSLELIVSIGWIDDMKKGFLIASFINTPIATMAQIISWYYYKRSQRIICRIMRVDDTLQKLGANLDYAIAQKTIISLIILWFTLVIVLNWIHIYFRLDRGLSFGLTLVIIPIVQFSGFINMLVALHFSMTVRCIEVRFQKLNELLVSVSGSTSGISNNPDVAFFLGNGRIELNRLIVIPPRSFTNFEEKRKNVIRTVRHVHLELMDISRSINQTYSIQLTLQMMSAFMSFTTVIHEIFRIVMDPVAERREERLLMGCAWAVAGFLILFIINHCCEKVSVEANRTGIIIHRIKDSKDDLELLDEIVQFSYQLMNKTVEFAPGGFFTLGYEFMRGFFGAVITYVVILIQMAPKPSVP